jgi:hypothetical protein
MAHRNYEARQYETWGPKVRWDVNVPESGVDGHSVYQLYAFNDNNDIHLETFNESGAFRIINDRGIEIVAGEKGSDGNVDICITGSGGDVWITAMQNGTVKIKGKNIMVEGVEDVDIKAGRNLNLLAGSGRITMVANKIDKDTFSGNLSGAQSFVSRAYAPTPVGADFVSAFGVGNIISGIGGF